LWLGGSLALPCFTLDRDASVLPFFVGAGYHLPVFGQAGYQFTSFNILPERTSIV